jgi:hypothetical protein
MGHALCTYHGIGFLQCPNLGAEGKEVWASLVNGSRDACIMTAAKLHKCQHHEVSPRHEAPFSCPTTPPCSCIPFAHFTGLINPPPYSHFCSPELKDLAARLAARHGTSDPVVVAEQRKKRNYAGEPAAAHTDSVASSHVAHFACMLPGPCIILTLLPWLHFRIIIISTHTAACKFCGLYQCKEGAAVAGCN